MLTRTSKFPYAGLYESLTKKNNICDVYNNEKNVPLFQKCSISYLEIYKIFKDLIN